MPREGIGLVLTSLEGDFSQPLAGVYHALEFVQESAILSHQPMAGSAVISLVNAGLEGFARAAALEAPRGIRVNVVSPPWVTETLKALNMDPGLGKPAVEVAKGYVKSIEGEHSGEVIEV